MLPSGEAASARTPTASMKSGPAKRSFLSCKATRQGTDRDAEAARNGHRAKRSGRRRLGTVPRRTSRPPEPPTPNPGASGREGFRVRAGGRGEATRGLGQRQWFGRKDTRETDRVLQADTSCLPAFRGYRVHANDLDRKSRLLRHRLEGRLVVPFKPAVRELVVLVQEFNEPQFTPPVGRLKVSLERRIRRLLRYVELDLTGGRRVIG